MDYEQFFIELRNCYLENGLKFDFDFERIRKEFEAMSFVNSNSNKYFFNKNFLNSNNKIKIAKSNHCKSKSITYSKKDSKIDNIACFTVKDFVYKLAFALAQKIGRLPDHLHSRILLSTDKSIYKNLYFKLIGT